MATIREVRSNGSCHIVACVGSDGIGGAIVVKIRKVDVSLMDAPGHGPSRALTPAQIRRVALDAQLRAAIAKIQSPADVFEIRLEDGEKPITIRQRLLRLASGMGTEIAVRKHGDGLLIGLLTPERRSTRGRRRANSEK